MGPALEVTARIRFEFRKYDFSKRCFIFPIQKLPNQLLPKSYQF